MCKREAMPKLSDCTILITGTQGQVGHELIRTLGSTGARLVLAARGHLPLDSFGLDAVHLDLEDHDDMRRKLFEVKPDILINPAAYTAVDKAEVEAVRAYSVNQKAVQIMGQAMKELGGAVIHFSTDYVYNSSHEQPNLECDSTNPCNVYGASKLAGEQSLMETAVPAIIFRTSWVYGGKGNNFVKTIIKLAKERESLSIVADQVGSPTSSHTLAEAVLSVLIQGQNDPVSYIAKQAGIYNLSDEGFTTWLQFAEEILAVTRELKSELKVHQLIGIRTTEYKTPALRPLNSRMSLNKVKSHLNIYPLSWKQSLRLFLYQTKLLVP